MHFPHIFARSALVAFLITWGSCAASSDATTVRIGVLSYREQSEAEVDWGVLPTQLTRAIPEHRFELRSLTSEGLYQALQRGELEFVLTNSSQYISLAAKFGIRRIATVTLPEAASPDKALGSTILTLANRNDISKLSDLRGKRVAVTTTDAFGGYLIAARELLGSGIDLEAGDAHLVFVGFPMSRAIDALRTNKADVAIVRTCLFEQLSKNNMLQSSDFKVVSPLTIPDFPCATSTRLYPDWPLAATRRADPHLAKAVAVALLSMPASSKGLSWSIPADYQSVIELDRELMIGPYSDLRTTTLRGLLKNYRPYLLTVLLLFVGMVGHAIRVQILIKRRTSELRASQANACELQRKSEHMTRLSILGEMATTLAHELNQPLTTIATYAQGLERLCASGQINADMVAKINSEIVAQTMRADKVIRRVREFARKRIVIRETRPIADTINEAMYLLSTMLPNPPLVTLDNRLPLDATFEGDHLQLQQVLLNLMKNAADSMLNLPSESRVIDIVLDRIDGDLNIAVADNGPQVSDETLTHLFEPFFTTKPDGLGLGLAICKSIIEAHGGHLSVHPRDSSSGLIFRLNLPEYRNNG